MDAPAGRRSPGDRADVIAIIPTLDPGSERIDRTMRSVRASIGTSNVSIVVVDNSPGGTTELVDPSLATVVRAGMNLGWAGGLAWGVRNREFSHLWLIQDDVTVAPDCLHHLLGHLAANQHVAAASPLVVRDGVVPVGTCGGRLGADGTFSPFPPAPVTTDLIDLDSPDYVPSRGTLVRADAWRSVGGMSPSYYPLMWADVDFSFALIAKGHGIGFVREAAIDHEGSASGSGTLSRFLWARNRQIVVDRWNVAFDSADPDDVLASMPSSPTQLDGHVAADVPRELLEQVAQAASDAFLHLARWSDATRRRLVDEIDWHRARADHAEAVVERLMSDTAERGDELEWWKSRALHAEEKVERLATRTDPLRVRLANLWRRRRP